MLFLNMKANTVFLQMMRQLNEGTGYCPVFPIREIKKPRVTTEVAAYRDPVTLTFKQQVTSILTAIQLSTICDESLRTSGAKHKVGSNKAISVKIKLR